MLFDATVNVSMEGRGHWMDSIMIKWIWRLLKHECVFSRAFETKPKAKSGIGRWIAFYNTERPDSAHGGGTPAEAHHGPGVQAAA